MKQLLIIPMLLFLIAPIVNAETSCYSTKELATIQKIENTSNTSGLMSIFENICDLTLYEQDLSNYAIDSETQEDINTKYNMSKEYTDLKYELLKELIEIKIDNVENVTDVIDDHMKNYTSWIGEQIEIVEILDQILVLSNASSRAEEAINKFNSESFETLKDIERDLKYIKDTYALKSEISNTSRPYYPPVQQANYSYVYFFILLLILGLAYLWKTGKLNLKPQFKPVEQDNTNREFSGSQYIKRRKPQRTKKQEEQIDKIKQEFKKHSSDT